MNIITGTHFIIFDMITDRLDEIEDKVFNNEI